jgi:hypothetical protein
MSNRRVVDNPVVLGLIVGLIFGGVNLAFTWLDPPEDDSPGALLRFYGPMSCLWALASFRAGGAAGGCCQA